MNFRVWLTSQISSLIFSGLCLSFAHTSTTNRFQARTLNSGLCYTVMIHHLGKRNLWFSSLRNETGWLLGRRLWCLWLRLSFYMERPSSPCFKLNVVPSSDFRKIGDLRLFTRRSIRMKMIHISDTNWHRCHSFPDLFAEQLLNFCSIWNRQSSLQIRN